MPGSTAGAYHHKAPRQYIKKDMRDPRHLKAREAAQAFYANNPRVVISGDARVELHEDGAWVSASVYVSAAQIGSAK